MGHRLLFIGLAQIAVVLTLFICYRYYGRPSAFEGGAVMVDAEPDEFVCANCPMEGAVVENETLTTAKRKQLVRRFCEKRGLRRTFKKTKTFLTSDKLYVDDKHKFIYCHMPKTASTTWLKVLLPLNGYKRSAVHKQSHQRTMASYTTKQALYRLRNYFKFLFVREPFERFLSAYKDKVSSKRATINYNNNKKGAIPFRTFPEFVRHFTSNSVAATHQSPLRKRGMWNSVINVCEPCLMEYNFIGHYETLWRDANFVLTKIGIDKKTKFPQWKPTNTSSEVRHYYNQLSTEQQRSMYQMMKEDYEMFGYTTDLYV